MSQEQTQIKEVVEDKKEILKPEDKAKISKKIIAAALSLMKVAFSKGDADTVWYKKGIYYAGAAVLGVIAYAFSSYGIEIIDWVTNLVTNMF